MKMLVRCGAVVPCLLALPLLGGCSCTPVVDGVVATDTFPTAPVTVRTYLLPVPASGDLNLTFTRQDDGEGYAGSVYLFVTPRDCAILTDDPLSMRDGQTFRPKCPVLANSYKEQNCCAGRVTLASPARVTKGETVKVFVYGLFQPADLPYVLTLQAGDSECRSSLMAEGMVLLGRRPRDFGLPGGAGSQTGGHSRAVTLGGGPAAALSRDVHSSQSRRWSR